MFRPQFPAQGAFSSPNSLFSLFFFAYHFGCKIPAPESAVLNVEEHEDPLDRVQVATSCLPPYDPLRHLSEDADFPFLYWTIRDYAHAYRSNLTSPTIVSSLFLVNY